MRYKSSVVINAVHGLSRLRYSIGNVRETACKSMLTFFESTKIIKQPNCESFS